jgi:hypothetical protein
MSYYPPIKIKPNTSPHVFVERLDEVIEKLEGYQIETIISDDERCERIIFTTAAQQEGIKARIISARNTDVTHVHIRIEAPAWELEMPDYTVYSDTGKELMTPVIESYNKLHKTNLRLQIKTLHELLPHLSPKMQAAFDAFITPANKILLGGEDWKRYYRFIRLTHGFHIKMDEEQLFCLLLEAGFEKKYARYLSDIYLHGRALLNQ